MFAVLALVVPLVVLLGTALVAVAVVVVVVVVVVVGIIDRCNSSKLEWRAAFVLLGDWEMLLSTISGRLPLFLELLVVKDKLISRDGFRSPADIDLVRIFRVLICS